jgi:hypothetical protein
MVVIIGILDVELIIDVTGTLTFNRAIYVLNVTLLTKEEEEEEASQDRSYFIMTRSVTL